MVNVFQWLIYILRGRAIYEALLIGLKAAKRLGIKGLKIFGDFELVIKQVEGIYGVKSPSLAAYRVVV